MKSKSPSSEISPPLNAVKALASHGYTLLNGLGAGKMGAVFRARQDSLDRLVAVKILHPVHSGDADFVTRFQHEARLVAKLNHPHIVTGIDTGSENDVCFFIMEFLEGGNLQELVAAEGPLPEEKAIIYLAQCVSALEHAGQIGLIHCDVKPANLMRDGRGQLKLTDFGIASILGKNDSDGKVRGTPHYLSPEQIRRQHPLDGRADIYALGATFYHLVTGKLPFSGKTAKDVALARLRRKVPEAAKEAKNISPRFSDLLAEMMVVDRDKRISSAHELFERIEDMGVNLSRHISMRSGTKALKKAKKGKGRSNGLIKRARESIRRRLKK